MQDDQESTVVDGEESTVVDGEESTVVDGEESTVVDGEESVVVDGEESVVVDGEDGAGIDAAVEGDEDGAAEGFDSAIDAEDLIEELAEEVEEEVSPYDRPGKWYVVHTQSGYENKVKQNLEARISSMNMEGRIHEVAIPVEDVVEFKNNRKQVVQRKVFPGYLLVRCEIDDGSWYVIRNTPGVTGFVGAGSKPTPLRRREVEQFLKVAKPGEQKTASARPRLEYGLNETVRVKEGPFADFSGQIVEINEDQMKVKVLVNIFGRETPLELEFSQIARL
jgi:transcription termination/antitermination protein NusG